MGGAYEYIVLKITSTYFGLGYIYVGIEAPLAESRGKAVLLVDNTQASSLAAELARLQQDLAGDGWTVLRHDVARSHVDSQRIGAGRDGQGRKALGTRRQGWRDGVIGAAGGGTARSSQADGEGLGGVPGAGEEQAGRGGGVAFEGDRHHRGQGDQRHGGGLEVRAGEVRTDGDAIVEQLGEGVAVEQGGHDVGGSAEVGDDIPAIAVGDDPVGTVGVHQD